MTLMEPVELENFSKQWPEPSCVYTLSQQNIKALHWCFGSIMAIPLSVLRVLCEQSKTLQSVCFVQVWTYPAVQTATVSA